MNDGPQWEDAAPPPADEDRDPFAEATRRGLRRSPREWLRLWFGVKDSVDALSYFVSGSVLALVKYAAEAWLIFETTGNVLTPLAFLNPSIAERDALLQGGPEWVRWVLLMWQFPFVWVAFSTSVRRCANAGLSPWLGMVVLVPYLNLVFMLVMSLLPTATGGGEHLRHESKAVESYAVRHMAAILAGSVTFLAMFGLGVVVLQDYGVTLFFAMPLVMGVVNGYVYNRLHPTRDGSGAGTVGSGCLLTIVCGGGLVGLMQEGVICLLMAAPIIVPLVLVGTWVGKAIAEFAGEKNRGIYPALLALPLMAVAEPFWQGEGPEYVVKTVVEVEAPPEVVWQHVVSFPDLPPAEEFYFRSGIACPLRARIEGEGVGAIRYCEFTTGDFVEPVTVWDEPRVIAFDVTEQPHPMFEVNPFGPVHPPHLEELSLRSRRGEFRLVPLPGDRTRLEGRTWYTFDMHPRVYWTRWSNFFISSIHDRVLQHVKRLAETDVAS